jgi:hypothetical protein
VTIRPQSPVRVRRHRPSLLPPRMIYSTTVVATALSFVGLASAKIYLKEDFNDAAWKSRWTVPTGWKSEVQFCTLSYLTLHLIQIRVSLANGNGPPVNGMVMPLTRVSKPQRMPASMVFPANCLNHSPTKIPILFFNSP